MGDATVHPFLQLRIGLDDAFIDVQPAVHLPASHLEASDVRLGHERLGGGGVNAQQEPTPTARADSHVAVDEKRKTAEHRLLAQASGLGEKCTNAVCEVVVVRHERSIDRGADNGEQNARDSG